ncbi:hypothetical protein Vadar_027587 [Vaccinium darrowii]|uniref:Uncharacterized protein n=1 Tax=Vaccinium darrowii TaxID=229202 RepID=A0ACB7XV42_9ERIC|nr:hypothetical protein Vadar_027587 [Vaccinium darrowii]
MVPVFQRKTLELSDVLEQFIGNLDWEKFAEELTLCLDWVINHRFFFAIKNHFDWVNQIVSVRNIVTPKDDAVREEKKLQAVSSYKHGCDISSRQAFLVILTICLLLCGPAIGEQTCSDCGIALAWGPTFYNGRPSIVLPTAFNQKWRNLNGQSTYFWDKEWQKHGHCCPLQDFVAYLQFRITVFMTFELALGTPIHQELI